MRSLQKMFEFLKPGILQSRGAYIRYIMAAIVRSSLDLVQPFLFGLFLDQLLTSISKTAIFRCCFAFLLTAILQILLSYYVGINGTKLQIRISNNRKAALFRHLQSTSPRFHGQKKASEMAEKINTDTVLLTAFLTNTAATLPSKTICLLLSVGYILCVDFWSGVSLLAVVPFLYFVHCMLKERIRRASYHYAQASTRFFVVLSEQFQNLRAIRLHNIGDVLAKRFYSCSDELEQAGISEEKAVFPYSALQNNMDTILVIILLAHGGTSVLTGRISLGTFTILYSYIALITDSLGYFFGIGQSIQQHLAFYTRLKELSDVPEQINGSLLPTPLRKICISDLWFAYERKPVIRNFSYTFKQDHIYCLTGENGAGKTTLTDLILGMYSDDTRNTIFYNDIPAANIDMYRMRAERIGVSEQEPAMVSGTVGFNITYRNDSYDTKRLEELFEILNFRNDGAYALEELLESDAALLSGGQKQKISIIKALYKNPELLVLDEHTSALDRESREKLSVYLKKHAKGRITILISHDTDMIGLADEVIQITQQEN